MRKFLPWIIAGAVVLFGYFYFKGSERVNPLNFYYGSISAKEYIEISKLANQENQSLD